MIRQLACLLVLLGLCIAGPAAAQTAADSARADLALLGAAEAARTFGAGPGGALDPALPTIHEFVDFACPTCRDAFVARYDSVKAAFVETGRANLIVRAFPIPRLLRGPHAAEAALCAGALGGPDAFSHLQRRFYETQADWRFLRDPAPAFRREAADARVDAEAFEDCLARDVVAPLLVADVRLGSRLGATGTPTFVFVAPGATEPSDLFYGDEPLARFEEAFARATAAPSD